ncbi:phosphoglycerate mutase family protein [Thalassotalea psychrophila]|uniref:Phosphoglycerate mutase family protein n=1 Tax=Thalassotalea psychrophila TaxID=3065647 RepID=A0ABY9TSR4_9GAMM|nr:phosphoglycerate mutase family protein [Colwelliaceae bacterium SQ149]
MLKNMLRFTLILFSISLNSVFAYSAETKQIGEGFTIYLVRHAEKQLNVKDPELTSCGHNRAESIAKQLELINLDKLYSTNFKRTMQTAKPIATLKSLEVESYNPKDLQQVATQLIHKQENAVVVGHSNTTAVLAGLLANQPLGSFDESVYDRIYQVVLFKGSVQLNVLQQSFVCSE